MSGFRIRPQKFLDQFDHRAGKQQQRDEVRDAHQAVEGIGDVPQQAEVHRRAQNGHERVDHEEGPHDLIRLAEELDAAGAVQAPADDGGECEAAQRHRRKDGRPAAVGGGESGDGQLGTGGRAVVHRHPAAQDDQRGQGADDDGIGKDFEDTEHPLLDRLAGVGTGVGDGAGAQTGLIGEDAAGNALLHTEENAADGTAREGPWVKRAAHDGGQHRREAPDVQNDNAQRQHHIEQCHKGTSFR